VVEGHSLQHETSALHEVHQYVAGWRGARGTRFVSRDSLLTSNEVLFSIDKKARWNNDCGQISQPQ
jgi:hypothetical protein